MQTKAATPDGTQFVYVASYRISGAAYLGYGMYVVNADGTGNHRIEAGGPVGPDPGWSPDGSLLTYSREHVMYTVSPDGADVGGVLWDVGRLIEGDDWTG